MMLFACVASVFAQASPCYGTASWTADNGNGTFTNPLFYDEFSDPDVIRVVMTTTLQAQPCTVPPVLWCFTARIS